MSRQSEKILITGATGFLGSWIIAKLVDQGIRVVAADISEDHRRLAVIKPDLPAGAVDFRVNDVTDGAALEALVEETRPTAIIHLAALQIPQCRAAPALGAMVNIVGQINIFEAARKFDVKRLIYTSSIAAKPRGPANAPSNLYGVFKKTGEEVARIYWQDHRLASLGLRPYIVFGVGRDDGETSAITKAIRAAALNEPYEIPFRTRSCFQYAGDVADIFVGAALASWEGALISDISDTVRSTDDVLTAIQEAAPGAKVRSAETVRQSPEDGFDTEVLRSVIGDWTETPLEVGIRKTMEHFRSLHAR